MNKEDILNIIAGSVDELLKVHKEITVQCDKSGQDLIKYIEDLYKQAVENFSDSGTNGLLISKTPRINRKKFNRIKPIPEDSEVNDDDDDDDDNDVIRMSTRSSESLYKSTMVSSPSKTETLRPRRTKREASIRANSNISKQCTLTLNVKLRRPSSCESSDIPLSKRVTNDSTRFTKHSLRKSDNDSDEIQNGKKQKKKAVKKKNGKKKNIDDSASVYEVDDTTLTVQNVTVKKETKTSSKRKLESKVCNTLDSTQVLQMDDIFSEPATKKSNISNNMHQNVDNILDTNTARNKDSKSSIKNGNLIDNTIHVYNSVEQSLYEDAIGKPTPLMSSTMNPNSTVTMDKLMSATVVIEPIPKPMLNETVVIKKISGRQSRSDLEKHTTKQNDETFVKPVSTKKFDPKLKQKPKVILNPEKIAELLTDDESSPERKSFDKKRLNGLRRSSRSSTSDDEIITSFPNRFTKKKNKLSKIPSPKAFKKKELFSPYAKDSVKKRVEAFEQVAISPKPLEDNYSRLTRNKTKTLITTSSVDEQSVLSKKAARKSLARAIATKNAYAKEDETKENESTNVPNRMNTRSSEEKSAQKLIYSKTTPLTKNRLFIPNSASRNPQTPNQNTIQYAKTMPGSASRGKIIANVDSFIHTNITASASKQNADKYAEEKRRRNEEDVKKKKEELLKAQTEEKRRKREEKELKNKLAREAKEKIEMERRIKAEREKEEKLRQQMLLMQEKAKEEAERKKILVQQRAAEKEERRRQEELLRQQRIAEQEDAERLLAEQRRLDHEAEKRKMLEHRIRLMQMKKAQKKQAALNYKIDSDPDEDESDDENQPKHQIPEWAQRSVRQRQLNMQQYIPMKCIVKFFDSKRCTPDLTEFFKDIDPRKLKRSSSAMWKTPPRLSMYESFVID